MINEVDTTQIEAKIAPIPEQAKSIVVRDNDSMAKANSFKVTIKGMIKEVDDFFKPFEEQAYKMHRSLTTRHKEIVDPLKEAEKMIITQVKGYLDEVEKVRAEAERRVREEARRLAEERALQEAIELEKEGKTEEAERVIAEPVQVVMPTVKVDIPKVDMRGYAKRWKWRLVDITKVPREYLIVDEIKVNGIVRSMKDVTSIPGIEIYEE